MDTSISEMGKSIKVFCGYVHEDQTSLRRLLVHLRPLERQGLITVWSDMSINAGYERDQTINEHLNTSQLILLLVSADFLASDDVYGVLIRALQRSEEGEARIIPIILRPVFWENNPLSNIQVLPKNGKSISQSHNVDEAFLSVVEDIEVVCQELLAAFKPPFQVDTYETVNPGQIPVHFYQLYEVFVKSGVPNITFVESNDFTRLKLALAQPGRGVVIEGPSGVGKTTSLKKAIESLTSARFSSRKTLSIDTPVSLFSARNPDHRKKLQTLTNWHNGIVVIDDFHRLAPSLRMEVADYLKYLADTETDAKKIVIVGIPQSGQILVDLSFDVATRIEVFKWGKVNNKIILKMIEKGEKALNIEIDRKSEIVLASSGSLNVAQFLCFNVCQREEVLLTQDVSQVIQPNISKAISEVMVDLSRKFAEPIRRFVAMGGPRDSICLNLLKELAQSDNGVLSLPALSYRRPELANHLEQFIQQNWVDKLCKEYPHFLNFLFFDPTISSLMIDDPQFAFYLSKMQFEALEREMGKINIAMQGKTSEKTDIPTRNQIFISYSHKDLTWLEKLLTMLKPLERQELIKTWSDTLIQPGTKWKEEINKALASAKIAILLVTPEFLASDFIAKNDLPPLLEAAKKDGLIILWIAISYSMYKVTELGIYQAINNPAEPLDSLSPSQVNRELVSIAEQIKEIVSNF